MSSLAGIKKKVLKDISDGSMSKKDAQQYIQELKNIAQLAEDIANGNTRYCEKCNDYYLAKSFFTEYESKSERILTYSDPINSGGNEYRDGKMRYTYQVCPKGHRSLIDKHEE